MQPNHENFESRIERLRPVMLTLAEALLSPAYRVELEASDLVQQTLLEAHQQAHLLNSIDDGPFFAWLRTALQHNLLDAVKNLRTLKNDARRTVRASELEDSFVRLEQLFASDETSPSEVAQRNEQTAALLETIQCLPDNQRKAIILKHLRGHSLQEVAGILGLSEPAAAGLLHRGRKQLIERLGDSFDD